jgi:phosphoesterase RecJ-like protein
MTDTGSFRFPSMSPDLHRTVAKLMEAGARHSYVHEMVYDNFPEHRLRLLGYCLQEKLTVLNQHKTAYIAISEQELNAFHFRTGDTEGVVNYVLGIKGIRLAAFFSEKQGLVKISFRSHDDFSVKELAEKHFEGGGHKNAAGGKSLLSLQQTVDKFIALLPGLKLGS